MDGFSRKTKLTEERVSEVEDRFAEIRITNTMDARTTFGKKKQGPFKLSVTKTRRDLS